ncbi:AAA family ATPase [Methylobacterium sp. J-076]|uniref:AAA family ATPase n=1 Tax=Methylobacterium sp. J-076 TaxID=2836655 RepID=UPI001FBB0B07|nr:AAA family ATPase [Methylobacterium sp. J-076]MCJ2015539.1 AAA family ATPase [Methylobacterium sp. J-076]
MTDPLAGAECYSALAILSGRTPPPVREDLPYDPYFRYVDSRYPTMPTPESPGIEVHNNVPLAHLGRSGRYIRQDWMEPSPYDDDAQARVTLTALGTLHHECMRHAGIVQRRMTSGIPLPERRALQHVEESMLSLARIALVPLAETGDRHAIKTLVLAAEERVHAIPGLLPFCVGARANLASPEWPVVDWRPDMGAFGIIEDCIRQGTKILDRRAALQDIDEDSAGIVRRATPTGRKGPHPGPGPVDDRYPGPEDAPATDLPADMEPEGVEVFPASILDAVGKGENKTAVKQTLGSALGARLPLAEVPADWDAWEAELVGEAPWLAAVPRALRAEHEGRTHWRHTVLCVEGPPGAGKTRIIRRIARLSELPYVRINSESASDTSTFGTSIRWMSAQAGVIERELAGSRCASALVHYDELEKAAGSRQSNSGKITDLLHGLFEQETAQSWRSPWLGVPVDVGHLVHVATVNSLGGLPPSLMDRMRVIRVGEPGPEHLAGLAARISGQFCIDRGMDPRWGTIDGEELAALAGVWPGGSVRRLQRLVDGLLRARDGAPGPRH